MRTNKHTLPDNRVNLTAPRLAAYRCPHDKQQAFLWDNDTKQLALRATRSDAKAFIFQSAFNGNTVRITIGKLDDWTIPDARAEARRLQQLIDQGKDPRQVKADAVAAQATLRASQEAARDAERRESARQSLRVCDAWAKYLEYQTAKMSLQHLERGKKWGARHLRDHVNLSQAGGEKRERSARLTKPGVLYPLLTLRLAEISAATLTSWQRHEAQTRPNNARQGFEMFRAFWRWCAKQAEYKGVIDPAAVEDGELRDEVPSRKDKRFDVLERSHLAAWFSAVRALGNPVISAYLQALILTGARREEMGALKWADVDFQWGSIWLHDKVAEEGRKVPLTPYLRSLIESLPRRNEWVFSSPAAAGGRIVEPRIPHNRALSVAGLPMVTLHGLRRSFSTLAEWVEMPRGVVAQIMGHLPSATAEKHYINRPLDLLAVWHTKYEAWILEQTGIPLPQAQTGLRNVK